MPQPADQRYPVRLLLFSASLRDSSLNTRLADLAGRVAAEAGAIVDRATMREFEMPSYDGDVEQREGFPSAAEAMRERIEAANALVIVSPEYNFSMPGVLKNAIDWVSRFRPQPFRGTHALLMSASPSMVGGNRGLWALRVPLEHLGAHVYPDMFSLARAHAAFTDDGRLADEQLQGFFEGTVRSFIDLVEAATHYPCAKARWVEFLGEHPEAETARVEA